MKKFILITILLNTFFSASSQINTYFDNNPVWKVIQANGYLYPCLEHSEYNYYVDGDTTINTFIYKKIFEMGIRYYTLSGPPPYPICPPNYSFYNSTPSFFVRSADKKIFIKYPMDATEYLLHDFNLTIGDTLPATNTNPAIYTNIVTGIDSVLTPNGYLKRFEISGDSPQQYVLEGMGSSAGLIEPLYMGIGVVWNLECYSLNDTSYFPSTGLDCEVIIGVAEIKSEMNFSVYPNPFTDYLIVKKEINDKLIFKIYNSEGKLVENKFINSGTEELKVKTKSNSGFYFYSVTDEKGNIKTGKLIKTSL